MFDIHSKKVGPLPKCYLGEKTTHIPHLILKLCTDFLYVNLEAYKKKKESY